MRPAARAGQADDGGTRRRHPGPLAIPNKALAPRLDSLHLSGPLRILRFPAVALTEGVDEHLIDGVPVLIGQFLGCLARDMADHPDRLSSVDADLLRRIQSLVGAVEVDRDAPLAADDE